MKLGKLKNKDLFQKLRTMGLTALKTRVLLLLILAVLTGCVNLRTVKIPQEYSSPEGKIAVVPIETIHKDAYFSRTNLETILNEMSYGPGLDELKQIVVGILVNMHPETLLCDKIARELARRGRAVIQESEIVLLPENIRSAFQPGLKWYNPDISVFDYSVIKNRCNPTVIMEASFEGIIIFKHATLTVILIRVIDPHTNKVIARKHTVQRLYRGKYNLRDPIQREQYVLNFKSEFENELAKAIPKILDGIGF